MKIAILGAHGQLGQAFCRRLGSSALALGRADADLTRPRETSRLLRELRPETVINCAACNLVDAAEEHPLEAMAVNFLGVADLARTCAQLDCLLVHFSTNYVFGRDRARSVPYAEDDEAGPIGVYGYSKLAGEFAVRSLCPRHFVVRTCGLYGPARGQRGNFVQTMLALGQEKQAVQVVDDQVCSPTFVDDLAEACLNLTSTDRHGVYHLTSEGSCSWLEFARSIFALSGMATEAVAASSQAMGRPAERPAYSVLDCGRYRQLGFPALRSWREALRFHLTGRSS